jgi:hypothetical protein
MTMTAVLGLLLAILHPGGGVQPCRGRLVLLGDSNVSGAFGKLLERRAAERGVEVVRVAKGGTGLARSDRFDWVRAAAEVLEAYPAEVALMVLGGNDTQGLVFGEGPLGGGVGWGRAATWEAAYRQRLGELFAVLSEGARTVYFFGPTNRGGRATRARTARIRGLQQEAASRLGNLHWVDSHAFTSDASGRVLWRGRGRDGKQRRYRQGDGVHLTWAGGSALIDAVEPLIQDALERACSAR